MALLPSGKGAEINDDQYHIVSLIQNNPQSDALKTVYLAELLELSLDRPVNLYQLNIQEATQKLLNHPLIKKATIKKFYPERYLFIIKCGRPMLI